MRILLSCLLLAATLTAADPLFQQSSFKPGPDGMPPNWTRLAPRDEIAPRLFVEEIHNRGEAGALATSAASVINANGGWERTVEGVKEGQWYRLVVHYRTERLEYEPRQVVPRLAWSGEDGRRAGWPDFAYKSEPAGDGWTRVAMDVPAPEGAVAAKIQLLLWNSSQGTVYWDDISLTPIPDPGPRHVKVAAINLRPRSTGSSEVSITRFIETIDRTVPKGTDVIVLGEGATIIGTGKSYLDVAEPVPGPTTRRLGEAARRHNSYLVAGLYEKEGPSLYNIAVLIDRSGRLIGKYRKVQIPREETDGGIAPGSEYPVFTTDFGKVGLMICFDSHYTRAARALALRGAELLLLPIWGGNETVVKARAIENRIFIASAGYDYPTHIIDPNGEVIAIATEDGTAAIATLDLNKRYLEEWLGDMRGRLWREIRFDVKVEPRR